jgi:general secretion pathway protein B
MSFILDALRKSEHERQRQSGPALVETPVATPKPRGNPWATAAIALLLVNLVAVGVFLLLKSRDEPASASVPPQATSAQPAPAPAAVSGAPRTAPAPTSAPAAQATVTRTLPAPPPMLRPAEPPPSPAGRNPLEEEVGGYSPPMEYEAAASAAAPPPGPPAVARSTPGRGGTVTYQSVPEAYPITSATAAAAAEAIAAEAANPTRSLPRADEVAARGGTPELRLELHVYSTKPAERFVFINSHRYREGDRTQEGATVEQITPDGVIMSAGGSRFLLGRD